MLSVCPGKTIQKKKDIFRDKGEHFVSSLLDAHYVLVL